MEIATRTVLFLGIIQAWGGILRSKVNEAEFLEFAKDAIFLPVRILFVLPYLHLSGWLSVQSLKKEKLIVMKNIADMDGQVSDILIRAPKLDVNFDDLGKMDTESIERRYGSLQILNGIIQNADGMQAKVQLMKNALDKLQLDFSKNSELLGSRVAELHGNIAEYEKVFDAESARISGRYQSMVDGIGADMANAKKARSGEKQQFEERRRACEEAIRSSIAALNIQSA